MQGDGGGSHVVWERTLGAIGFGEGETSYVAYETGLVFNWVFIIALGRYYLTDLRQRLQFDILGCIYKKLCVLHWAVHTSQNYSSCVSPLWLLGIFTFFSLFFLHNFLSLYNTLPVTQSLGEVQAAKRTSGYFLSVLPAGSVFSFLAVDLFSLWKSVIGDWSGK